MSHKKRYRKVSEMVRAETAPDFAEAFEKRLADRQLVKHLQIMRARHGLSQEDVATRLNCSQGRISKLESGDDSNVRVGDLLKYAGAAGYQLQFVFFKSDTTTADQVKYHFFETKQLLGELVELAKIPDEDISKGIASFFEEACGNFIGMLAEKAKALPKDAVDHVPLVKLVSQLDEDKAAPKNGVPQRHCRTNGKSVIA
jgi:transcriptional regulator with XRE-family HTH domain